MFGTTLGLGLTALAATCGLWTVATSRFMVPNTTDEPDARFRAGRADDYRPGQVESRYKESHGVWIVCQQAQGGRRIVALSTACTHLGCITIWNDGQREFRCPCHGSGFSAEGINLEGPAPRPLERFAVRLTEDGQLEIDRSRTFREELGQWDDPASFVLV